MRCLILFLLSLCLVAEIATASPVNLAENASVTIITGTPVAQPYGNPARLVDGDRDSWHQVKLTNHKAEWEFTLPQVETVYAAHIEGWTGVYIMTDYRIEAYVDSTWETIVDVSNNDTMSNDHDFAVPVTAQKFRFECIYSIWDAPLLTEFELYDDYLTAAPIPEPLSIVLLSLVLGINFLRRKRK